MKYISKAKLISLIIRNYRGQGDKYNAARIIVDIERMPEEDVSPVKRGRWVGEYDGYADGCPVVDMWSCSVCGKRFDEWEVQPTWKFCPCCGAKMEVEDEDD